MFTRNREPLTPEERKGFWRSLCWAVASVAVWPLMVVWVEGGWPVAVWLGAGPDSDWLFHSDVVVLLFFLAFQACLALSIKDGWPARHKRPICLLWMFGPFFALFAWPFVVVILVRFGMI